MSGRTRKRDRLTTAAMFGAAGVALLAVAMLVDYGDPIVRLVLLGAAALDLVITAAVAFTA